MGDVTIAQDLIEGVTDALADLGDTRQVRIVSEGVLDPLNPGAGKPRTTTDTDVEALLYDYEDRYINGASVLEGDRQAIIDIAPLTGAQVAALEPGNFLIDGSKIYSIVRATPIEAAGITVTVVLQIRG